MRNPQKPQRDRTEANRLKTQKVIESYQGKDDLLRTWDNYASDNLQIKEHGYILGLRARVRQKKNLLSHRSGPEADL